MLWCSDLVRDPIGKPSWCLIVGRLSLRAGQEISISISGAWTSTFQAYRKSSDVLKRCCKKMLFTYRPHFVKNSGVRDMCLRKADMRTALVSADCDITDLKTVVPALIPLPPACWLLHKIFLESQCFVLSWRWWVVSERAKPWLEIMILFQSTAYPGQAKTCSLTAFHLPQWTHTKKSIALAR